MYVSSVKKDGFQGEPLTTSSTRFEPFSDWVKTNNALHTPMPIHRLCTQTFSPPQKTNVLLGIEPAANTEIVCLSCTRKFLVDRWIPNGLVDMISMDHRLNDESRHPFRVTCVDSCDKRGFECA